MEDLKENRRYRRERQDRRRLKQLGARRRTVADETYYDSTIVTSGDNANGKIEFNYVRVSLELLRSLTSNLRLKWVLSKLLRQPDEERAQRSMMSSVFWPSLWEGIWHQFVADVPRSRVEFDGKVWRDPRKLYEALEQSVGPLWSRWLCVFLNQAPMADVFSCVIKDMQKRYGNHTVLCDGNLGPDPAGSFTGERFGFNLYVEIVPRKAEAHFKTDELRIRILKNFAIRHPLECLYPAAGSGEIPTVVETEYVVTFYPYSSSVLSWSYK